jgi:hypothetical protein
MLVALEVEAWSAISRRSRMIPHLKLDGRKPLAVESEERHIFIPFIAFRTPVKAIDTK